MAIDELQPGSSYAQKVGVRLRMVRKQKNLSLQDVESGSQQEFKASVLGAYERGERAVSVPRLQRLARFYGVPVDRLLPTEDDGTVISLTDEEATRRPVEDSVTIDLTRLQSMPEPDLEVLNRYVTMIQLQRQDFNGRVLTIRRKLDELGLRLVT